MKLFVLYDKSGIHSGRVLGSYLIRHQPGGVRVQKGRPQRLALLLKRGHQFDYIINVGWFRQFNAGKATILNLPEAISLSSNKRKARTHFKAEGIPAPKLWLTKNNITARCLPVIARTTHHTKGKGLWFCTTMRELDVAAARGATHYLKFIPNTREFRVHVMAPKTAIGGLEAKDYRVVKLSEKLPNPRAKANEIVKSHERGWIFGYPKDKKDPVLSKVRNVGKETLASFGLHWGAVDIMVSRDTGEIHVLEINSTPCLTDDSANTLEKYSKGMCFMLGLEQPPPKKESPPTPAYVPACARNKPVAPPEKPRSKRKRRLLGLLARQRHLG